MVMEYLTLGEVAEELRVNPRTVRRWLESGELVGCSLAGRSGWRIARSDLAAFVALRRWPKPRDRHGRIIDRPPATAEGAGRG
jgi:two-component system response regulator VicR